MRKIPRNYITASILCVFVIAAVVYLGIVFSSAREKEPIYPGEGVTSVRMLSDWYPELNQRRHRGLHSGQRSTGSVHACPRRDPPERALRIHKCGHACGVLPSQGRNPLCDSACEQQRLHVHRSSGSSTDEVLHRYRRRHKMVPFRKPCHQSHRPVARQRGLCPCFIRTEAVRKRNQEPQQGLSRQRGRHIHGEGGIRDHEPDTLRKHRHHRGPARGFAGVHHCECHSCPRGRFGSRSPHTVGCRGGFPDHA